MPASSFLRLNFSRETRFHILKHFGSLPEVFVHEFANVSGYTTEEIRNKTHIPGSKFSDMFVKGPDELYTIISELVNRPDTRLIWRNGKCEFEWTYQSSAFPSGIGYDCLINIDLLNPGQKQIIQKMLVHGYEVSVLKGMPEKTWTLNAILRKISDYEADIVTIFPGRWAPPFPNSFEPGSDEYLASSSFWNNYVFLREN